MPRSKDPRSYPREYAVTLLKAYRTGEYRLPPMKLAQARRLRSEFYSYLQAVRAHPEHSQDELDLMQATWQVSFKFEGEFDGSGVVQLLLFHKENTESARFLRGALGMKSSYEEAQEAEARILARLNPEPQVDPMTKTFDYSAEEVVSPPKMTGIQRYLSKDKEQE